MRPPWAGEEGSVLMMAVIAMLIHGAPRAYDQLRGTTTRFTTAIVTGNLKFSSPGATSLNGGFARSKQGRGDAGMRARVCLEELDGS
jgi:hypothetical protein